MKKFASSKNTITLIILGVLISFFVVILILNSIEKSASLLPLIALGILTGLILWIVLDTRYVFKDNFLLYRSGPFRGRINIDAIQKIKKHSGLYVPVLMKPALDINGFIITAKTGEIFISPKKAEIFKEELLKRNPAIISE